MSQNLGLVSGLLLVTRVAQTLKSPAKFARSLKTDFVLINVIEFVASGLELFWKSLNACHKTTVHLLLAIFYTEDGRVAGEVMDMSRERYVLS